MQVAFKSSLSILLLMLLFEGMVTAFHLLNLPSDRAVFQGMAILTLLAVLIPVILRRLWRNKQ